MNGNMIEFLVLSLTALVILLAAYVHQALGEIDELHDKIDRLEDENRELDRLSRFERKKAEHYKMIAQSTLDQKRSA